MPQSRLASSSFSPDIREFLTLLHRHDVRYMIVGGEAVIFYGYARLTGDIDLFYDLTEANTRRLLGALDEFWGGQIPGIEQYYELMEEGVIIQFGRPPNRIDLLNHIDSVAFHDAWPKRRTVELYIGKEIVPLNYLSLDLLIKNKESVGRPKDLEDLEYLRAAKEKEEERDCSR